MPVETHAPTAHELPLLSVEDLRLSFPGPHGRGRVLAVDGVSLTLHAGQTLALVGESGCGKSSLARAILQLHRPDSGSVRLRVPGSSPQHLETLRPRVLRRLRRHLQVVFEDPYAALDPRRTVNSTVRDFVLLGDTVYICGSFSAVQGQARTGIAALSRSTGALLPWDPAPNTTPFFGVATLATDGNLIYAGGMFTAIGGQLRNRIAALNPSTGLATAWNPSADAPVNDIVVAESGGALGGSIQLSNTLELTSGC